MAVQWPFASFLVLNPAARNTFFNANNYVYWASNAYVTNTHRFPPANGPVVSGFGVTELTTGAGKRIVTAELSLAEGLAALLADPDLAWRCLGLALLADEIAED